MLKKFILMCKDIVVAEKMGDTPWKIYKEHLIPKGLDVRQTIVDDEFGRRDVSMAKWQNWLAQRVLSIDRAYAKKLLNALLLTQGQDTESKAKIAISVRAISVLDSYWLRFGDDDTTTWEEVNLRKNSLSKSIALIALAGQSFSLQIKELSIEPTAEITTLGSYAKGWFREGNQLWLYKAKGPENDEVEREICASNVIDCFNVYGNLKYESAKMHGVNCSRCKLMANEELSVVHAADMRTWTLINGREITDWTKSKYRKEYSQMVTIDYLIANSDRHMWNWGFFQEVNTGKIIGLHPLYDHNNAFDIQLLKDENWKSIVETGYTMKEAALHYVKSSGLQLVRKPTPKIFPSKLAYDVFLDRCKQLGLWENKKQITSAVMNIF